MRDLTKLMYAMCCLLAAATVSASCPPGLGEICYNGSNYGTIEAALAACPPGETVTLGPGTFYAVDLANAIRLHSEKIVGSGQGVTIIIPRQSTATGEAVIWTNQGSNDNVKARLENLTVQGRVRAEDNDGLEVVNVEITNLDGQGIWGRNSGPILVDGCHIHDTLYDGVYSDSTGSGVAGLLTVKNCLLEDVGRIGVSTNNAPALVEDNTILRCVDEGVKINCSVLFFDQIVRRNQVNDCGGGVQAATSGGATLTIENNDIVSNEFGIRAVALSGGAADEGITIDGNTVTGTVAGTVRDGAFIPCRAATLPLPITSSPACRGPRHRGLTGSG